MTTNELDPVAAAAPEKRTVRGCAVVTAGPGTTDAATGVANAFRAESQAMDK